LNYLTTTNTMVKIKVTTTVRNAQYLNGLATYGDTFSVPEDYAQEIVEEKGFAEYVEEEERIVEVRGTKYPGGFLDMEIPENFPNERIYNSLQNEGFEKFGEIIMFEDPTEIKGIGEDFANTLEKAIIKAKNEYISSWQT